MVSIVTVTVVFVVRFWGGVMVLSSCIIIVEHNEALTIFTTYSQFPRHPVEPGDSELSHEQNVHSRRDHRHRCHDHLRHHDVYGEAFWRDGDARQLHRTIQHKGGLKMFTTYSQYSRHLVAQVGLVASHERTVVRWSRKLQQRWQRQPRK